MLNLVVSLLSSIYYFSLKNPIFIFRNSVICELNLSYGILDFPSGFIYSCSV